MSGKLIVIEGGDGSGKATQTKLLVDALYQKQTHIETISFPRYDTFYGKLIKRFLSGEFGTLENVSPYLMATLYAADRWEAKKDITGWLEGGGIVIADRYVSSNMAHQAAKLAPEKRPEIIAWIEEMEYVVNGMPRPDMSIYLHVPPSVSLDLISKNTPDITEEKIHQEKTEEVYKQLANSQQNWAVIECVINGKLRSIQDIHTELLQKVSTILI